MEPDKKTAAEAPLETLEETSAGKNSPENAKPGTEIKPADKGDSPPAPGPESAVVSGGQPAPKGRHLWRRLKEMSNLYLVVFVLIIVAAVITTVVVLIGNNKQNSPKKSSSLTSGQLAQLQGNTTIVGDAKQTLDIQSNTILEGQMLVRKDLNVAGSIKVGGGLSLSSVTVGGGGNFGQLQINGTLSVSGNTNFSGLLSIQKNLTVAGNGSFGGTLSATQLSVTNFQLTGDLQVSRHIGVSGPLPAKVNGSALGSGGTASLSGSDTAGTVTLNTGSSPSAGSLITVNFANRFNTTPHVVVTPIGPATAGLQYYVTRTSTSFTLSTANAPPAGSSFSFDYIVFD